jgi:hypothetical protein
VLAPISSAAQTVLAAVGQLAGRVPGNFTAMLGIAPAADPRDTDLQRNQIDSANRRLDDALGRVSQALLPRLRAAGIDLRHPLTIRPDGFGGVETDVDHPQFAAIDSILQQSPDIQAEFSELVRVASQHPARDPNERFRATSLAVKLQGERFVLSGE